MASTTENNINVQLAKEVSDEIATLTKMFDEAAETEQRRIDAKTAKKTKSSPIAKDFRRARGYLKTNALKVWTFLKLMAATLKPATIRLARYVKPFALATGESLKVNSVKMYAYSKPVIIRAIIMLKEKIQSLRR